MLKWEPIPTIFPSNNSSGIYQTIYRAKVPGGWIITNTYTSMSPITFYPDPDHKWDGSSLP